MSSKHFLISSLALSMMAMLEGVCHVLLGRKATWCYGEVLGSKAGVTSMWEGEEDGEGRESHENKLHLSDLEG